ncbi:MAG: glycosyltransferase [Candidatus Glassbacteria bacterium]
MSDSHIRILFYSQSPHYGGAEEYVYQIARGFPQGRFRFSYVHDTDSRLGRFTERLREAGVEVHRIQRIRGKSDLVSFMKHVRFFRRLSPDVVHFNQSNPYSQQYSVLAARLAGIRCLLATYHLTPQNRTRTMRGRLLEKLILRLFKRIIVLSGQNRDELLSHFSVVPGKVRVIENGVEDQGEVRQADLEGLRRELGIVNGKQIVACAGRLTPQKGFGHLLEAARQLGRKDVAIVIAGEGPSAHLLRSRVEQLRLGDSVIFTGFREDVWKIFCLSDLVAIPSIYEGQPLVLLQAMAAGKAVVASNIHGLADTVRDGETGILVEPGSVRQLANAIGKLLDENDLRMRMGQRARELYKKRYTASEFQRRMEAFYMEVTPDGRGR